MATFGDTTGTRKKITTYGKTVRRRLPEFGIGLKEDDEAPVSGSAAGSVPSSKPQSIQSPLSRTLSPAPQEHRDIFDLPSSDGEDYPKAKSTVKKKPQKLEKKKAVHGLTPSRTNLKPPITGKVRIPDSKAVSISPSSRPSDIYDCPLSGDEVVSKKPNPINRSIQQPNPKITQQINSTVHEVPSSKPLPASPINKRRRLSPVQPLPPVKAGKPVSLLNPNSKAKSPTRNSFAKIQKNKVDTAFPQRLANRPKVLGLPAKSKALSPSKIMSAGIGKKPLASASVPTKRASQGSGYISPDSAKIWKGILDSAVNTEMDEMVLDYDELSEPPVQQIDRPPLQMLKNKPLMNPAKIIKRSQREGHLKPRRRLIDTLVEQATVEDPSSESDDECSSDTFETEAVKDDPPKMSHDQFAQILSQTLGQDSASSHPVAAQSLPITGPKFTYSRQRSMLAEEDLMQQLAVDMPSQSSQSSQSERPRRGVIPPLSSLPSFKEDEEMADAPAVTSVHELRQSGANQRFLEEVEDLLDAIGKPSSQSASMRRSGLSEMASKLREKTFLRQFRDNGVDQRLFVHLGQEKDVIAGFYLISMLMMVLLDSNMPHTVAHLRRQGITRLLIRLVTNSESILKTGKDRKSNMSKMALSLLSEHHDFILTLSAWEDLQPQSLSPRTVALKCLELMVRQTREAGKVDDIFSKEMTTNLFGILDAASGEGVWEIPQGQEMINFQLALSILELHSVKAMTAQDGSIWIGEYLPIVAKTVVKVLGERTEQAQSLQYMLLRLMGNVTNNDSQAAEVFAQDEVMQAISQAIITKFEAVSRIADDDDLPESIGELIVTLGVMINLAESDSARQCFGRLCCDTGYPLTTFVQLFTDNQEKMLEADTQEESQRNVPFGYLSILLGYLSLSPRILERVRALLPGRTLRSLLSSIEQFISYHKAVDELLEAEEDGYHGQSDLTARLQSLVDSLGVS